MICPKCNNEMAQVIKHGVTIDTCTVCNGVWLDKGELGELMARINQAGSSLDQELSRVQPPRLDSGRSYRQEEERHYGGHHDDHDKYRHKKRSIWDIFD